MERHVYVRLLIVISGFAVIRADRERIDSNLDAVIADLLGDPTLQDLFEDPNILPSISKRLGSRIQNDALDDCPAARRKDKTIIKTKQSLENGAVFLSSPEKLRSTDECVQRCCQESRCDTAISKSKDGETACYLFQCGLRPNKCVFSANADFSVTQFVSPRVIPQDREDQQHVDDLAGLVTTTPVAPTASPRSRDEALPASTGDRRPECASNRDCVNSECVSGYCACRDGYHAVGAHCRADCNQEFQFECANVNEPTLTECIAIYDRCDFNGIEHCKDGSDEFDCPRSRRIYYYYSNYAPATSSALDSSDKPNQSKLSSDSRDATSGSVSPSLKQGHSLTHTNPDKSQSIVDQDYQSRIVQSDVGESDRRPAHPTSAQAQSQDDNDDGWQEYRPSRVNAKNSRQRYPNKPGLAEDIAQPSKPMYNGDSPRSGTNRQTGSSSSGSGSLPAAKDRYSSPHGSIADTSRRVSDRRVSVPSDGSSSSGIRPAEEITDRVRGNIPTNGRVSSSSDKSQMVPMDIRENQALNPVDRSRVSSADGRQMTGPDKVRVQVPDTEAQEVRVSPAKSGQSKGASDADGRSSRIRIPEEISRNRGKVSASNDNSAEGGASRSDALSRVQGHAGRVSDIARERGRGVIGAEGIRDESVENSGRSRGKSRIVSDQSPNSKVSDSDTALPRGKEPTGILYDRGDTDDSMHGKSPADNPYDMGDGRSWARDSHSQRLPADYERGKSAEDNDESSDRYGGRRKTGYTDESADGSTAHKTGYSDESVDRSTARKSGYAVDYPQTDTKLVSGLNSPKPHKAPTESDHHHSAVDSSSDQDSLSPSGYSEYPQTDTKLLSGLNSPKPHKAPTESDHHHHHSAADSSSDQDSLSPSGRYSEKTKSGGTDVSGRYKGASGYYDEQVEDQGRGPQVGDLSPGRQHSSSSGSRSRVGLDRQRNYDRMPGDSRYRYSDKEFDSGEVGGGGGGQVPDYDPYYYPANIDYEPTYPGPPRGTSDRGEEVRGRGRGMAGSEYGGSGRLKDGRKEGGGVRERNGDDGVEEVPLETRKTDVSKTLEVVEGKTAPVRLLTTPRVNNNFLNTTVTQSINVTVLPTLQSSTSNDIKLHPATGASHGEKKRIKNPSHEEPSHGDMAVVEERLILSSAVNQSAVVALALGIILTSILLVFVGCRMRQVSRKSRKGRPLGQNEADYLINGMYL